MDIRTIFSHLLCRIVFRPFHIESPQTTNTVAFLPVLKEASLRESEDATNSTEPAVDQVRYMFKDINLFAAYLLTLAWKSRQVSHFLERGLAKPEIKSNFKH